MTDKQPQRLLDRVREAIRVRHYSYRTEQQYVAWIRRFILFHGKRHPLTMGGPEVSTFLSYLASERDVAAATQAQALAALLFLYRDVLQVDLPWLGDIVRARRPKRIPVVLTRDEVQRVLAMLPEPHALLGATLYGAGLRLTEGLTLRVKDLDLARRTLVVRNGKGAKDRVSVVGVATTSRGTASSASSRMRCAGRASRSRRHPIACGTASRRTCSRRAPTSARCRSCWVTRASRPPRSIRTC